jgi:hypothetical protein
MPSNALREAFREVLLDPGLVLIEVAWRWTFGATALLFVALSVFVLLGGVSVDPRRLQAVASLPPLQLAQTVAATLIALRDAILRVSIVAIFALTVCWVAMSALGRRATLVRPALSPGASLGICFVLSAVRAGVALGALLVWILVGILAGLAGGPARGDLRDPGGILRILFPALVIIVAGWSALNWYLSLAPIFSDKYQSGNAATQMAAAAWEFVCSHRDVLLEISLLLGLIRFVIFVAAAMLSFAVSAVITSPRVLIADLFAIALLYFSAADFLYIVRLVAYAELRGEEGTSSDTADVVHVPATSA